MKHTLLVIALLAVCGLAAGELKLGNGLVELRIDGGKIALYAAKSAKPAAVFAPAFKGSPVKVFVVDRRPQRRKIVRLSTPQSSIAIELPDKAPYIRLALNRNASPVKVTMVPGVEATVVPDPFAEDAMFFPGKAIRLPAFAPGYLMMLKDGSALTCLPTNARDDAEFSSDLKTLTVSQKNTEDYIFVLNAGPKAWAKTMLPELGKQKNVTGWKEPFPALWQASYAVGPGFVPAGDGLRCNWNIATVDLKKKRLQNSTNRFALTKIDSFYGWLGGFEGSFRYPAVVKTDGTLEITHTRFRDGSRQRYDAAQPLYIYAFYPLTTGSSVAAPGSHLQDWVKYRKLFRSTSFSTSPTTCSTTGNFEKIFRNEKGAEQKEEIIQMLASMQCFVEGIRGRVENARVWGAEMREFAAAAVKANPSLDAAAKKLNAMLDTFETLYKADLPRIQQPPAVEKLSAEVIALADSKIDPEELEGKAKKLGAAIRTIGGGQDNLAAYMRHVGKCIRQQSIRNYAAAASTAERRFWGEVYQRAESMLQALYGHDGK